MQNPLPTWSLRWSSWLARSETRMGAIERDQMRRFLRRWSGKRGWLQFGIVIVWNTLVAVAIASWTGKLSFLDLQSGRLVIADPKGNESHEIVYDASRFPESRDLHDGSDVKVTASFDGSRYVASAIVVE